MSESAIERRAREARELIKRRGHMGPLAMRRVDDEAESADRVPVIDPMDEQAALIRKGAQRG